MRKIKLALNSLSVKKGRTFLTLLSITIGIAAVLLIGVVSDSGKALINKELDSLGLNGITLSVKSNTDDSYLKNEDLEFLRGLDYIKSAFPIITGIGQAQNNNLNSQVVYWGIDSGGEQIISLNIIYGMGFKATDIMKKNNVCLIDINTAKQFFSRENAVGSGLSLSINGKAEKYTVIGVISVDSGLLQSLSGDYIPNILYIPYTTIQQRSGTECIDQIAVKFVDKSHDLNDKYGNKAANAINQFKTTKSVKINNISKQRDKLSNMLNIVTMVLSVIGAISLFVAGIGITTVMLVSVSERTREIGIKKAIGAQSSEILREFLIESILLSFGGYLIGLSLVSIIVFAASMVLNYSFTITINQIIVTLIISLICGVIFGVYPALKAAKMDPVISLRRE